MLKKVVSILLLCVEIGLLLLLTPTVFWKAYYFVGPTERYGRRGSGWLSIAIFGISIACVIFILKSQLVKSMHIKVVAVWVVLMLAAITIVCIGAAYMMGFP